MDKRAMVVLAGGFALLVSGACWGCPSSPSSVSITVVPTNVPVFAGAPQEFSATGAPGPFNWSLPSGGGEIQPGSRTATVTAGATAGAYRVRATFQGNTGEAQFTVVTTRTNFISASLPTFASNTPVPGCRLTFLANYVTSEDGLRIRAVVNDANGNPAPPYQPMSAAVGAAGQVELQAGTTNATTESVDVILFREVDIFHIRLPAHYVWPSCQGPTG